jgi:hypothetical protein
MKLIQKIAKAKNEIKESKLKKEGKNKFSNYDYFTPPQVELLVNQVCASNGMLTKFDLIRDTLGVFGRLTIFDTDSEESLSYDMASAIPEIKATNIAQQLGGCVTYTERYLKMSAFGITDANLDFDSQDNRGKIEEKTEEIPTIWLTEEQFNTAMKSDKKGILATLSAYNGMKGKKMKSEYLKQLTEQLNQAI